MGKAHVGGVTDWLSCKARGTLEVFCLDDPLRPPARTHAIFYGDDAETQSGFHNSGLRLLNSRP